MSGVSEKSTWNDNNDAANSQNGAAIAQFPSATAALALQIRP